MFRPSPAIGRGASAEASIAVPFFGSWGKTHERGG